MASRAQIRHIDKSGVTLEMDYPRGKNGKHLVPLSSIHEIDMTPESVLKSRSVLAYVKHLDEVFKLSPSKVPVGHDELIKFIQENCPELKEGLTGDLAESLIDYGILVLSPETDQFVYSK